MIRMPRFSLNFLTRGDSITLVLDDLNAGESIVVSVLSLTGDVSMVIFLFGDGSGVRSELPKCLI